MPIAFSTLSHVFNDYLKGNSIDSDIQDEFEQLLFACIDTNTQLWNLEDVARMHHLGVESIANTKMEIDVVNHRRNELINKLDDYLATHLNNTSSDDLDAFYAESPGMLIDRLSILFIKQHFIQQLINRIEEEDLKKEFEEKQQQLQLHINDLGLFLDLYLDKIRSGMAFFKIYKPLKIYNDQRIKKYIRQISKK